MQLIFEKYVASGLKLLPEMDSPEARAMLLAIGMQESRFTHRLQINGPARGWWQFEQAGIRGVLTHPATKDTIAGVCGRLMVVPETIICHGLVAWYDTLACVFARLLLWTLPSPLPGPEQADEAWRQYIEAWRPGRPHRETWHKFYNDAWKTARQISLKETENEGNG